MEGNRQNTGRCPGPRPVLEGFLRALLMDRDPAKALLFLTVDVLSAGPDGRTARSREEFRAAAEAHLREVPGQLPYGILDYREKEETPECRTCLCRIRNPGVKGGPVVLLSAVFRKSRGSWRISGLHISGTEGPVR